MTLGYPLLSIDRIEASGEKLAADIRVAGRPDRVELSLEMPGVLGFARMPEPLAHDDAARRAVIDWMTRAQGSEAVATPVDLSAIIRQANGRWPLRLPSVADRPARESAAAQVPITVSAIEKDAAEPGLVTVRLTVAGRDAVVIVDVRIGPGREPRFRFAEGLHPWQATSAESDAMLRALVLAAEP